MNIQMKVQKIIGIIIIAVIILTLCLNTPIAFATNDEDGYFFGPDIMDGTNNVMVKKGEVVNEIMNLRNSTTNRYEEEAIDVSKINVEVSDPNLVTINNNVITAKEEGEITVIYTHVYENMYFRYEGKYYIYDEVFSNFEAPVINKSYMNLRVNGTNKKINVGVLPLGSIVGVYGYDNYNYIWSIEDSSIAKIERTSVDSENVWKSSVNVIPLKAGTTKVTCVVQKEDESESITKSVDITVIEDNASNYIFEPEVMDGPNNAMVKKGEVVNEIFNLWNRTTNSVEERMIDESQINVEVSDPNLVTINNNIITAKDEGEITVIYKHTYENMNFEYEGKYYIYDEAFSRTVAPVINKSYLDLMVDGGSKKINAGVFALGSAGWPYASENYKYTWSIEDSSIAKIEEVSVDSESEWKSSVNVTPLKVGKTKIICVVQTEDGSESITKTVSLNVTTDKTPIINPVIPEQNESGDNTTAIITLPAAGRGGIIIAMIIALTITAIVFYKKGKID